MCRVYWQVVRFLHHYSFLKVLTSCISFRASIFWALWKVAHTRWCCRYWRHLFCSDQWRVRIETSTYSCLSPLESGVTSGCRKDMLWCLIKLQYFFKATSFWQLQPWLFLLVLASWYCKCDKAFPLINNKDSSKDNTCWPTLSSRCLGRSQYHPRCAELRLSFAANHLLLNITVSRFLKAYRVLFVKFFITSKM